MARNVEIKARLSDVARQATLARTLAGAEPEVIDQDDVFFNVPRGRLKLRTLTPRRGELIFYERPDACGPKTSSYQITRTDEPEKLASVLTAAYGVGGRVVKMRRLWIVGRTRIHFDVVAGLGEFVELEVVLADGEDPADGEREARELMRKLDILPEHLIDGAYVDMIGILPADG